MQGKEVRVPIRVLGIGAVCNALFAILGFVAARPTTTRVIVDLRVVIREEK